MGTPDSGKHKHQRIGRVPPHGPGERVIDSPVATSQELPPERQVPPPPVEYKREQADDVPGVKRKLR